MSVWSIAGAGTSPKKAFSSFANLLRKVELIKQMKEARDRWYQDMVLSRYCRHLGADEVWNQAWLEATRYCLSQSNQIVSEVFAKTELSPVIEHELHLRLQQALDL